MQISRRNSVLLPSIEFIASLDANDNQREDERIWQGDNDESEIYWMSGHCSEVSVCNQAIRTCDRKKTERKTRIHDEIIRAAATTAATKNDSFWKNRTLVMRAQEADATYSTAPNKKIKCKKTTQTKKAKTRNDP